MFMATGPFIHASANGFHVVGPEGVSVQPTELEGEYLA
jgi:hypothetical protein